MQRDSCSFLLYLSVESWLGRGVTHNLTFIHRLIRENILCQLLYLNKRKQWLFLGSCSNLLDSVLEVFLIDYILNWILFQCYHGVMVAHSGLNTFLISRQLEWSNLKPYCPSPALRPLNLCCKFVNTSPHWATPVVEPCSWGVSIMPCCMLASMYGGITLASSLLQLHGSLKRAALKGSSCLLQQRSDIAHMSIS